MDFAGALRTFSLAADADRNPRYISVHFGLYDDETALLCQWHLPATHSLESWGDLRAFDGTASVIQPLILRCTKAGRPSRWSATCCGRLDDSKAGDVGMTAHDLVRTTWQPHAQGKDFSICWETCLRRRRHPRHGGQAVSATDSCSSTAATAAATTVPAAGGYRNRLPARPQRLRRRFANNGWLQELPKPISKLTWDNARARISPRHRRRKLGVSDNDRRHCSRTARSTVDPSQAARSSAGLGRARTRRRLRHVLPRLRPQPRRPRRRHGARLQRLRPPHVRRRPCVRRAGVQIDTTTETYLLATTRSAARRWTGRT